MVTPAQLGKLAKTHVFSCICPAISNFADTANGRSGNKQQGSSSSSSSESRWLSPQLPHEKYQYAPHAPHCMLHIADLHFHSCQKYNKFTDILFLSTVLQFQVSLKS